MAPITSTGLSSPPSALAQTGPKTRCIRPRRRTPTASRTRRQQVRDALCQRASAAGQRVLVADDVRRRLFLRANKLDRYTLSPRNALKYNEDGSLDLYIQNESPGKDKESNWCRPRKENLS